MLSNFPFLTAEEYHSACQALVDRAHACKVLENSDWLSIRLMQQTSGSILRISRSFDNFGVADEDALGKLADPLESALEMFQEDDPEALIRSNHSNSGSQVEYDIVLSPTYQVPVLYFVLKGAPHRQPFDVETVYRYLVPDQYKKELKSVGVMGGISFDYHPDSGAPMYFVHPCNTADAMRHVAGWQDVNPESYLLMWLGLIGNCVNLHLPYELFADNTTQSSQKTSPKSSFEAGED